MQPPQTVDELLAAAKALTTSKVKGLFVGNDGGVGVLGGPLLWSAGLDYLTKDNTFGFDDPAAAEAFGKLRTLFTSGSLLLGAPTDWSDPSAISQGLTAMQWTGLWTLPDLQKNLGDDFGVLPFPKLERLRRTVGAGGRLRVVRQRQEPERRRGKGVRQVAVGRPDRQAAGLGPVVRVPHPGPQEPRGQGGRSSRAARPPTPPGSSTRTATRSRRCSGPPRRQQRSPTG